MKDTCVRTLPSRAARPTNLHVRVLRSNSKLPKTALCDLPEELLLYLLKFLPLCDLQNIYRVNKQFKWLLDSTPRIWAGASVVGRWPSSTSELECFIRLADLGNLEAMVKLGVAYLYSEGVDPAVCKDGSQAARCFARAEKLAAGSTPFTWLFIRPPWNNNGTCCKARVFSCMKELCNNSEEADKSVIFCLAKLHSFLEEMGITNKRRDNHLSESRQWLTRAAQEGSVAARYELWKDGLGDNSNDAASNLNILRQLREFASQGCLEAKLRLYSEYARGNLGGVSTVHACEAIRVFVQQSRPTNTHILLRMQNGLNGAMRYILVDWLVEVGSMKDYSCLTIHTAVQLVDRFLMARNVSRATLQLVGITCMVVCSRLLEDDIITIREAAWLTDGTYKYEEVVRMLGDVVATLQGNLRVLTILDYLHLFCQVVTADRRMEYLALYISELSLLHADFGQYSRAHIAACSLYLARLILGSDFPWPTPLVEHTGLELKDLTACTLHLHNKCFVESPVKDHRDVTLAAVRKRFSEDLFLEVSKMEVIDHATLRTMLCVEEDEEDRSIVSGGMDPITSSRDGLDAFLLMSPSRKAKGQRTPRAEYLKEDRHDRVSTPTHEFPEEEELAQGLDIKPIDKDANESDILMEYQELDKVLPRDIPETSTAVSSKMSKSWLVLDESPSVSVSQVRTSHQTPSLSKDIPSTSSCSSSSSSTSSVSASSSASSLSSPSSSSSSSSSKHKHQVSYTINASGRLCQQRARPKRQAASPCNSSRSSGGSVLQQKLESTPVRYQFRNRTPVQSVKRKSMEDSSDEGGSFH